MQPYLKSLPNYIDRAHELPLTGAMELRPDQLRHHHEVSPRGSWNYVLTTYDSYFTNQLILVMHISLMPTFITNPHSYSMWNPYQLIILKPWNQP